MKLRPTQHRMRVAWTTTKKKILVKFIIQFACRSLLDSLCLWFLMLAKSLLETELFRSYGRSDTMEQANISQEANVLGPHASPHHSHPPANCSHTLTLLEASPSGLCTEAARSPTRFRLIRGVSCPFVTRRIWVASCGLMELKSLVVLSLIAHRSGHLTNIPQLE